MMTITGNCFQLSHPRKVLYVRLKYLSILAILFLSMMGLSLFYIPVRNIVFQSYITPAWRDLKTKDIIRIRYMNREEPKEFNFAVKCDKSLTPYDPFTGTESDKCRKGTNNVTTKHMRNMLSRGLGRYLPVVNQDMRMSILRLYAAMSNVLESKSVLFFLTAGSLLGVIRHGGFIPWDDDFDVGVHVSNMPTVLYALSCITGMEFGRFSSFHWKFHYAGRGYPFIDVFFYDTDDRYVWALTPYITITFVYLHEHVFPLQMTQFEGCVYVPIPGKGLDVLKRIYHYTECTAYNPHIGLDKVLSAEFTNGYSRRNVPCRSLVEFYKMNHLDE